LRYLDEGKKIQTIKKITADEVIGTLAKTNLEKRIDALAKLRKGEEVTKTVRRIIKTEANIPKGFKRLNKFGKDIAVVDEIADQINFFTMGEPIGKIEQAFKKVHGLWKQTATSGVVIPNFGFHSRNFVSNIWQNLLGGGFNPRDYWRAIKAQITKNDLWKISNEQGILRKGFQSRKNFEALMRPQNNTFKKFLYNIFDYPRTFGNWIEDNAKLAHFGSKLRKGFSVDDAVKSTEKFLFDYTDITKFERKLKNFIPFYVWVRKNIPLQVEMMLKKPVYYSTVGRAKEQVEKVTEPVGEEYMQNWMQDLFTVRVPFREEKGRKLTEMGKFLQGEGENQYYWTPDVAFEDLNVALTMDNFVNMVTPLIKIPVEAVALNRDLFRNMPIYHPDMPAIVKYKLIGEHVLKAIRPYQTFKRMTDPERDKVAEFLNQLFGIKLYGYDIEKAMKAKKLEEIELKRFETREFNKQYEKMLRKAGEK